MSRTRGSPVVLPIPDRSTLQLSGSAELSIEPDRARISMSVSETGTTLAAAKETVDERAMRIQKALVELGVGREDINASQLMVHPVREREMPGREDTKPPEERYRVSRQITVDFAEIGKLDEVLDRAITLGANRVWNVSLYTSKEDSLKLEAMKLASVDARKEAETLASVFGRSLGKPVLVEHDFGGGGPVRPLTLEARGRGGDFARGTITVTAIVNVVYELRR
jgi:hypothetical protein